MWIVEIKASYETEEQAKQIFEIVDDLSLSETTITLHDTDLKIRKIYGNQTRYPAVRPGLETLHSIFDPIATNDYYRPWPWKLELKSYWSESD